MTRKWGIQKKIEFSTLCGFGAWLLLTIFLWNTQWLLRHRAEAVFALFFFLLLYILLGIIRKMPQFRLIPAGLSAEQAERLIRLRTIWTAELRLVFVFGFAGTALTLPVSAALRRSLVGLFLLALAASLVYFLLRSHSIVKEAAKKP